MHKRKDITNERVSRTSYILAYAIPVIIILTAPLSGLFLDAWKYPLLEKDNLFFYSLACFISASLIYLLFSFFLLRTLPGYRKDMARIFLMLFLSSIIFSFSLPEYINGALDTSKPVKHENLLIYNKEKFSSSRSTSYSFCFESWRKKECEHIIFYDSELYDKAIADTSFLMVITRKGYLGYEWVEKYKLQDHYSLKEEIQ